MKVCLHCGARFAGSTWECGACGRAPAQQDGCLCFAPALAASNEGFRPGYFADLASREAAHFWFRARNKLLVWALGAHFRNARAFLEIGCGTGFVLTAVRQAFPAWELSGSDVYCEGLHFARERLPGVALFQMDARRMPFADEFDVIGAFDVLEHIDEDEDVLRQMHQSCKPGGGIIVTVPQHRFLWSPIDDYSCHKRRYSRRDLVTKTERAGFTVVRAVSFVTLLLPLMLAARLRQRRRPRNIEEIDDFKINPLVNRGLETVMGLERQLVRAGLPLAVGGSLLVVAAKGKG
jgi:SAM-dependent methyltransferase